MENNYRYELKFKVRDYECDLQGVVNNSTYFNYLEHTRHEFLLSVGIDFAQLHQDGIDLIVVKNEAEYKLPLVSGDEFVVKLNVKREGNVRLVFEQDIYRIPDGKLVLKGKVVGASIKNRRPIVSDELLTALGLKNN